MAKLPGAAAVDATKPVASVPRNSNTKRLLGFAVFISFLIGLLCRPLTSLVTYAINSDLHSYILLVPFISAYLIYLRKDQLPKTYITSFGWALIPAFIGLFALIAAIRLRVFIPSLSRGDELTLIALTVVGFGTAGAFLFFGADWVKSAAFPVAFLLFTVPLPDQLVWYMETGSKLASAEAANWFFKATATPVYRVGNIFQLPGVIIEVAQECSGIRSSWVLFIASVLATNLFLKSPWRRIAVVAFVIPLGIIRNGFRILVIGLLCVHIGPQMIHSIIHKRGGPAFFALTLPVLFLFIWLMRKGESDVRKRDLADAKAAPVAENL